MVKVGITRDSSVGEGTSVSVGNGVGSGVLVGGTGVLVGIAAWVSATMVNAAETAVACISSALIVGSAGVLPHALDTSATTKINGITKKRFIK